MTREKKENMNSVKVLGDPTNSGATKHAELGRLLLDSSLILTTTKGLYNVKMIDCGTYIQVYYLEHSKIINKKDSSELNLTKITNNSNSSTNNNENTIEPKNINRSKLECQRLAKCNANEWKTFITLTYAENLKEIDVATKDFRNFIDKIKRIDKNLKYICIPEFQKRGAVHFHILTNIDIKDTRFISEQKGKKQFKHIKYWNKGYTKVDKLNNDIKKIIGYISKYMTKDIDNRLFNRHRYYFSRNLKKPLVNYLNLSNSRDLVYYKKILKSKNIIYENEYINKYSKEKIAFKEFM